MKLYLMKLFFIFYFISFEYAAMQGLEQNQYKNAENVHNSLFTEHNSPDRLSYSLESVPQPPKKLNNTKPVIEEQVVAKRIVDDYRKIFNYLDYDPVNELLSSKELAEAFDEFDWPKIDNGYSDNVKYAEMLIKKYDKDRKNGINFVEFIDLMEDLWNSSDLLQEKKCNVSVKKAKDVFVTLFHWLDRDKDSYITPEDILYGLSRVMLKDVNKDEIIKVFDTYDYRKFGKINQEQFLLAISNGLLDDTLYDDAFTKTFL